MQHIKEFPLRPNSDGFGSHIPRAICTEWTPSPSGTVPIRSAWPSNVRGRVLTNARIEALSREGWYGKARKVRALARLHKYQLTRDGLIIRCACGQEAIGYFRYGYLPKAGYYCQLCRETHRANALKEESLRNSWKARIEKEYV